ASLVICYGDYNCDGGVDSGDIEVFFEDWESANPNADVLFDGGIDFADIEVFFQHWEAGC
ncbi:MAG: hypothetical protein NTV94_05020, partial [Planctomycetota bacterium]|nr:hypothetical protein [Planctomycetota bacterium]